MNWRTLLLGVGLLVLPTGVWAQAQLTGSDAVISTSTNRLEKQLWRCDEGAGIAPTTASPVAGEIDGTCSSGDWSTPMDCREMNNLGVRFYEYGSGSAQLFVWDCLSLHSDNGVRGSVSGGTVPGTEAPAGTPSAADPDPLCVELTAPAGITDFDGLSSGTQQMTLANQDLNFIVAELQDCTGECDTTLVVSCSR